MSNEITAYFKGRVGVCESLYQYDYGMILKVDGVVLPDTFEAYFSNSGSTEAIPAIGYNGRVVIPNKCLANAGDVTAHFPLHTGENDGEVEYVVTFRVIGRARPVDDGTPEQQAAIEKALAALQNPRKVNSPLDIYGQVDNGVAGQLLRTKGNGSTEWVDVGLPTDEQTAQALADWLEEHPEAVTSVEDWSLTNHKLVKGTLGFVIPQMFGAVGNGVADDTDAFTACFDGAYKRILIPKGEYVLTDTITIPDGTTVVCDGTILKDGTFDHLFEIGSDCDVQLNIDIDKASATDFDSQTSADIYISGESGTRIHGTKILNTDSRYAIWVDTSSHIVIENCIVDTYVYTGIGLRDGNADVKVLSNAVINGHGVRTNRYPICINSSEYDHDVSRNIVCDGNYIEDQVPCWEAIDAHDLLDSVISNNTMVNTLTGIAVVGREKPSNNIVISGNVYKNNIESDLAASCFGITCAVYNGSTNIVISNNALYGCGNNIGALDKGGIKVYGIENLLVTDNIISCVSGKGIEAQSVANNKLLDFKIRDNIIENADVGINLMNQASINISGEILNNIIKGCAVGISGNENYGTGYGYCVYAKDNTFKDCDTEYENNIKGLLVSPSQTTAMNYGIAGQIIDFNNPSSGYLRSICTQSGTDSTPAVWVAQLSTIPFHGTYTINENGYVQIDDDRILPTAHCIGTAVRNDSSQNALIVTTKCVNKVLVVHVSKPDGTPYSGSAELSLVLDNRLS